MSRDPNNPVNRKMFADHDAQIDRLTNEVGGTGYEARRLARSNSGYHSPGPYEPSDTVRDHWRRIFGRMTEAELKTARDKADAEWEHQVLSAYPDEWKKGFSRMQLDLIKERLDQAREA